MSKKSNIKYQIRQELNKETKYGESKAEAKKAARKLANETGQPYQPPKGLYTTRSYNDYVEASITFANYCLKHHSEVRSIYDCEKYIDEYIENCRERNLSEWSITKYIHALCCLYHRDSKDFALLKGERKRCNIKRCRDI